MAHNGNHRTIQNQYKSRRLQDITGFLYWERVKKRLLQAALHRPLQNDKPASSLVKVRKHYEEDGGTFHLRDRDLSALMTC